MGQKKHTDEEIIKALECCRDFGDCSLCPYAGAAYEDEPDCAEKMHTDALALISRQKAEIERLQKHNSVMAHKHYIDGIKEFTEELKKRKIKPEFPWDDYYIYESVIDDVVEKMIGGADDGRKAD